MLTGKRVIVTGGNSGIGYGAAQTFAELGADVVLACRDVGKGEDAAGRIRDGRARGEVTVLELDLADLASVRAFAETITARFPVVDVLVNNAGLMAVPGRLTTADGFELQFGVNHLGHFALTGLLLGPITRAAAGRVVTVGSAGHWFARLDPADPQASRRYRKWGAYGRSKLANLLFAYELDRRLRAAGEAARSLACHPGVARSNVLRTGPEMLGGRRALWVNLGYLLAVSPRRGAMPTVTAAISPGARGGECIGPSGALQLRGRPGPVRTSGRSRDAATARALWLASEQLTGVRFLS
ncbi:oxidoreductase [Saccharomonospora sp. NPDC006951]